MSYDGSRSFVAKGGFTISEHNSSPRLRIELRVYAIHDARGPAFARAPFSSSVWAVFLPVGCQDVVSASDPRPTISSKMESLRADPGHRP